MSVQESTPIHQTIIQRRSGWVAVDWRELIEHRELLGFLIQRDIKVRYKQTILGAAWAVIQPVFTVAVFSVIFGKLAGIDSGGVPYPVFAFAGLLPWQLFSTAVSAGGQSLVNQQHLLTKVYLPRVFIPASSIGTALVDFAVAFVVFLMLMLAYGMFPGWEMLVIPLLTIVAIMAALGVSLFLAALTVSYRDFRFVIPFMIQVWMYITPIIFPISLVPKRYQWLMALNPMTGVVEGFRSAALNSPWNFTNLAISCASATVLLMLGMIYFRKTESRFADVA